MRRREFIAGLAGAAAAWPLTARAQQPAAQIGFLVSGAPSSFAIFIDAFNQGMLDNGLVEGRDYQLDLRFADGDYNRFDLIAAEVAGRKPAAIVVTTIRAAQAAQRATSTIPIVMTGLIDPVAQGLIASLARPGGNTTGLAKFGSGYYAQAGGNPARAISGDQRHCGFVQSLQPGKSRNCPDTGSPSRLARRVC